ncbi:hypothetical protein EJ02DRAFT_474332 [Clathrospora elynae]|uniref:Ig-like domain-containing protein n=1 Tax=Clathrospora elynae TaxID=706981 RepID=A0A6A5SFL7_9PLEO|nr:hypothetical protein EJ02DRAFT_474332 [Clathrospora elynae]
MRPALFALPAFAASVLADKVSVTWRHELSSGKTALEIQSADEAVLAESCSSKIGSLNFSNVDKHGGGSFTVGDKKYEVVSHPEDGPVCNRIYNGNIAVVECTGVDYDVPEGAATTAEDCFLHEENKATFRSLRSRSDDVHSASALADQPAMPSFHSRILGSRQTSCISNTDVVKVGDGNPHQNYLLKQISENIDCGAAPSCTVGETKSTSYTIGFSGGGSQWISGGFDVSKSWSTGNSYSCTGAKGDRVCIWYNTAHTACNAPYVLKSPNSKNQGGGYYCVIGTCRSKGDEYWNNNGRAGGP